MSQAVKNEGTELSLATDFVGSTGPIERCLQLTALAGFTHIHWCHHWNDDFVYTEDQIDYTAEQLAENGLKLADTHGSNGNEKCWISVCENERRAGVELVKNRIEFTARLGGDCLVLHPPSSFQPAPNLEAQMSAMARSLDELEAFCRDRGVRLALENATRWADYQTCIIPVIEASPPEYVGFCYDSGHHNIDMIRDDRERARKNEARDRLADRLLAVHLHDNNGFGDQHLLPFRGSVDWDEVAGFLVRANYTKPLNLEVNLTGLRDRPVEDYVRLAHQCAVRLEKMIN